MKNKLPFFALGTLLMPAVSSAQGIQELIARAGDIIALLIPITASLALLYFFWGLGQFILKAGDTDAQKEAKGMMFWGIIALFIITSIWGIVGFVQRELGIIDLPDLPTQQIQWH